MTPDGRIKSPVTIVITHYEQGDVIGAAIESALHQTVPCEIVVVDDGSSPSHRAALEGYPVHVIDVPHAGYVAAVKAGIAAAKGSHLVILNGDDVLHPVFVERTLGALASAPAARVATSGAYLFGPHTGVPRRGLRLHPSPFDVAHLARGNHLTITTLMHRSVWDDAGGFDPALPMLEDWDFWLRVAKLGVQGVAVDDPLFYYRHATRRSRNRAARARRVATFQAIQSRAGTPSTPAEPARRILKLGILAGTSALSFAAPRIAQRVTKRALARLFFAGPVLVPVPPREATPDFPWLHQSCCKGPVVKA